MVSKSAELIVLSLKPNDWQSDACGVLSRAVSQSSGSVRGPHCQTVLCTPPNSDERSNYTTSFPEALIKMINDFRGSAEPYPVLLLKRFDQLDEDTRNRTISTLESSLASAERPIIVVQGLSSDEPTIMTERDQSPSEPSTVDPRVRFLGKLERVVEIAKRLNDEVLRSPEGDRRAIYIAGEMLEGLEGALRHCREYGPNGPGGITAVNGHIDGAAYQTPCPREIYETVLNMRDIMRGRA